jgi:DNA-binding NarL/FixJ family response regulator
MRGVILVVEDDAAQSRAIARMLGGHTARIARTAEEAIAVLSSGEQITAALIDIGLPGFSGLDLLARMQATHPRVPAIIVSAHNNPEFINTACRLGARYLVKPINRDDLSASLEHALPPAEPPPVALAELTREYALSKRESEVLAMSLQGLRRDVIRDRLGISESTVKKIVTRLLRKCRATSLRDIGAGRSSTVNGAAEQ